LNLYVSGCSWTHGHHTNSPGHTYEHNGYSYSVDFKDPHVWVNHISPYYENTFNHALQASGIERLTRRLLEFLDYVPTHEYKDWVFVLQISQPNRQEFVSDSVDLWSHVAWSRGDDSDDNIPTLCIAYDVDNVTTRESSDYREALGQIYHDQLFTESTISAYVNLPYKQEIYRQFVNLGYLVNLLQRRGLKYLITAMDPTCFDPAHVNNLFRSADLARITNEVDTTNFIKSSLEIMQSFDRADIYDPCGHLNVEGNKIFANYIYTELKGHGFINE
jgi:hypothetical protein